MASSSSSSSPRSSNESAVAPDDGYQPPPSPRPLTVKEISDRATQFEWNSNIGFNHWLRTAVMLQQEGDIYFREGNLSQAYMLYLRYSDLILDKLKNHPEHQQKPECKKALRQKTMSIDIILNNLEQIKPQIERRHNEWKARHPEPPPEPGVTSRTRSRLDLTDNSMPRSYKFHASRDPALDNGARILDAGEFQDLAVELAQQRMRQRDEIRKQQQSKGPIRPQEEWDRWESQVLAQHRREDDTYNQMQATRKWLDQTEANASRIDPDLTGTTFHDQRQSGTSSYRQAPTPFTTSSSYSYPKIQRSAPIEYNPPTPEVRRTSHRQPVVPPKHPEEQTYPEEGSSLWRFSPISPERPQKGPAVPEKTLPTPADSQELPARPPKVSQPVASKPPEPRGVSFKPAAYLENGEPIRPVFLPRSLRRRFLEIAQDNTNKGLEMCGILCGTAVNNALFIRCLLIPEQKCTSDTCETENENSMLNYCIEEDLMILGWIHTHPTQTCFMSSRDLHTQAGYQVMLPESVAIVCAPRFEPSYGIFRLTKPPGLQHILDCEQKSTFHPHSVDNLYTGAEHPPGHVYEHDNLDWYVKDIRPGRVTTGSRKNY